MLVAMATVVKMLVGVATLVRARDEGGVGVMAGDRVNGERTVKGEPTRC